MEADRITEPIATVVLGSGNVASALAPALQQAGVIEVKQVFSPTAEHALCLAEQLPGARAVSAIEDVLADARLYLVAVKDDAVAKLAEMVQPTPEAVWLHTSGGVDAKVLSKVSPHYGVLYPLQTFSKGLAVDFEKLPVFIEGATERARAVADRLAHSLSSKVYPADGNVRCRLHAAAVFACNFSNHLWAMADDILRRETGADLSVLYPLLQETMRKAMLMRPADGQTGPAMRGDRDVIDRHCSVLAPDEAEIYRHLSEHIINYYSKK